MYVYTRVYQEIPFSVISTLHHLYIYIYTHSLKLGATLSLWSLVSEIAQDEKGIESDEEVPARFQMQFLWYTAVT